MERTMTRRMEDSTKIKLWRVLALVIAVAIGYAVWMVVMPSSLNPDNVQQFALDVLRFLMVVSFTTLATMDMFSRLMENHYYDEYLVEENTDEWIKSIVIAVGLMALIVSVGIKTGFFEDLANWLCTII